MSDPEGEELDKTHAALTQATRQRQRNSSIVVVLVAVAAIMVCASAVLSAWSLSEIRKLNQASIEERRVIRLGTECIVAEFSEHRHLNALGHRANAVEHGFTYPIPPESEPPAIPGVLEKACETFLQTTTTSTRR